MPRTGARVMSTIRSSTESESRKPDPEPLPDSGSTAKVACLSSCFQTVSCHFVSAVDSGLCATCHRCFVSKGFSMRGSLSKHSMSRNSLRYFGCDASFANQSFGRTSSLYSGSASDSPFFRIDASNHVFEALDGTAAAVVYYQQENR